MKLTNERALAYTADAASVVAAAYAERIWQAGLLLLLNIKYGLSVKIRGVG